MKTRVKAVAYMGLLAVLPCLGTYWFFEMVWSVLVAKPRDYLVPTALMVLAIVLEYFAVRMWRVGERLFAFQAILFYVRFRGEGGDFPRLAGEERVLSYLRRLPGLESRADEATALLLFSSGEKIMGGQQSGKVRK